MADKTMHSFASILALNPATSVRMLHILAQSAQLINELRPEWYRARLDGKHLRIFLGKLIVMTIEREYIWIAMDPTIQSVNLSEFKSWHWDEPELRPRSAKGTPYPKYSRPPSLNGFYSPSEDPEGKEWQQISTFHYEYLKQTATLGIAPDPRTIHNVDLATEISSWINLKSPTDIFEADVQKSISTDSNVRKERLSKARRKPLMRTVQIQVFDRNPDVVAEVLIRAAGYCERCGAQAPFRRASDGSPYLEVHHQVRLADGGDDTIENAVALCPNCHRQQHYGL
jgi:5-methylcytosine-specific restriction endonuclease McrA